jgi:hypothetical protein
LNITSSAQRQLRNTRPEALFRQPNLFAKSLPGRTLVSTNFAAFTVSLAAVARACSMLEINAVMFSGSIAKFE